MEKDDEMTQGKYDFGARIYDGRLGSFLTIDRFYRKFSTQSPYVFAKNSPIIAIDINGDYVSVKSTSSMQKQDDGTEVEVITHEIIITMKVLDLTTDNNQSKKRHEAANSDSNFGKDYAGALQKQLNSLSGEYLKEYKDNLDYDQDGKATKHVFKISATVEAVTDMSQVKDSDHLQVLVDNVNGKADPNGGGGDAVGIAELNGKISYVEVSGGWSMGRFVDIGVHEIGHNLGQNHNFYDDGNIMSYDHKIENFTPNQWWDIKEQNRNGHLNDGANSEITDDWNWVDNDDTSNDKPYKGLDKGVKIPKVVHNDQK